MRPIKLTMEAFNSYGGKQEIDFETFGQEGLFLITGPTGSGKTTIFDGIMYALFGSACSKDRTTDMVRSLVCDPGADTFVTLEFEVQDKRYTIRRSPRYRRPSKRGKGEVVSSAEVVLKMPDGTSYNKVTEIEGVIRQIIGLDKSQFRQVALLAQGDFRQILTGDTNERIKILRSLFGTDRYRILEEKLKERRQAATGQESALRTSIDSSILTIEGYPGNQPENFILEDFSKWNESQKEILTGRQDLCRSRRKQQAVLIQKIGKLEQQKENWDTCQKAREDLTIWKPLEERYAQKQTELNHKKPQIDQSRLDIEKTKQEIEDGKKKEELESEISKCSAQIEKSRQQLQMLQEQQKELEDEKTRNAAEISSLAGLDAQKNQVTAQLQQLKNIERQKNLCAGQEQQVQQKKTEYQQALQLHQEAADAEVAARQAYLKGQAGILAQTLEIDQPCPVCGSLEHPHPAKKEAHTPSRQDLDNLAEKSRNTREKMDQAFESLNQALQQLQGLNSAREAMIQSLPAGLDMQSVTDRLNQIHADIQRKKDLEALQKNLEKQMAASQTKMDNVSRNRDKLERIRSNNEGQLTQLTFPYATMQEALDKLQDLQTACRTYDQEVRENETSLKNAVKKTSAAQGILDSMDEKNMADVGNELTNARLERTALDAEISKLDGRIRKLEQQISQNLKIEASLKTYEAKLEKQVQLCTEINELYNAINGAANINGQGKMDLETYVLAAYYEQVLQQANLRLLEMSDGRYSLQRREEASGNSRVGLDLDVLDRWNMKVRPATGLSGGEAFMASLALALGLSDAIMQSSGGTVLDTLFVDEGFGSLDQDMLAKAVGTLYTLAGNRLVGIISHVEAIKHNVDSQIVVSQDKNGCSHARIIV